MWAAVTGPVGLVVAGVTAAVAALTALAWKFRARLAEIGAALLAGVQVWADGWLSTVRAVADRLPGMGRIVATIDAARERLRLAAESGAAGLRAWAAEQRRATDAADDFAAVVGGGGAGPAAGPDTVVGAVSAATAALEAHAIQLGLVGVQQQAMASQMPPRMLAASTAVADGLNAVGVRLAGTVDGMSQRVREQLGPGLGRRLTDGLRSVWNSGNVGQVLGAAFTGGGGWRGAAQALGVQVGDALSSALSATVARMAGTGITGALRGALSAVLPGIGGAVSALVGWLGGKLAGIGGPSKAERAARQQTDSFMAAIIARQDAAAAAEVSDLMKSGTWDKRNAQFHVQIKRAVRAARPHGAAGGPRCGPVLGRHRGRQQARARCA